MQYQQRKSWTPVRQSMWKTSGYCSGIVQIATSLQLDKSIHPKSDSTLQSGLATYLTNAIIASPITFHRSTAKTGVMYDKSHKPYRITYFISASSAINHLSNSYYITFLLNYTTLRTITFNEGSNNVYPEQRSVKAGSDNVDPE